MRLVSVVASEKPEKKLVATFEHDGRTKRTHFGAKGMDDYTLTHDKDQRDRYRSRHRKDLKGDPTAAGELAWHILWGESTSRSANIQAYKRKFNL